MARSAKRARALIVCALGALAILIGNAQAQTSRTAAQAERDRRAETTRAERLQAQAQAARRDVRQLEARLVEAGRRRAEAELAATTAELRLDALRAQIAAESSRRAHAQNALEAALIAAAFAERRIEPRAVRAGMFARAAAPAFAADERRNDAALAQARQLEAAISEERRVLAHALAAIETERTEIAALQARRRAAQTQLASEAAAAAQRARGLAREARNLRELAESVQRASTRAGAAAPGAASTLPTAWLAPAEGRVTRAFGARDGQGLPSQGVVLRTRESAQVVAPASGEIAYSGPFRSYGQVLILNLDGGYALVLTGLETIRVRAGETVRAGQPIGEMSASDTPAPELYVEVRREGRPVDPARWLNARGLAAERSVRAG